ESGPRAGNEQPDVIADARQLDRRRAHTARNPDERRHRLHRREEVLRGLDRLSVPIREMSAHPLTELGIRIEPSPCRRAADPELCELGPPGMQTSRRAADPLGPAGALLAEG